MRKNQKSFARSLVSAHRGFGGCLSKPLADKVKKGETSADQDPNIGIGEVVLGPVCGEGNKPKQVHSEAEPTYSLFSSLFLGFIRKIFHCPERYYVL